MVDHVLLMVHKVDGVETGVNLEKIHLGLLVLVVMVDQQFVDHHLF